MNSARTVAMIAACPYPSGQGTQALIGELAGGLAARGHRVHLICYGHGAFSRREPFALHRLPALPGYRRLRSGPDPVKPLLDAALAVLAARVVTAQRCDLIHAHNYEGALAGWLAARLTRRPLVYHAHNRMETELPAYAPEPFATAAGWFGAGLDRAVPRLADRVIALHRPLAEALRARGVPAARLAVVEPGIDLDAWRSDGSVARDDRLVAYCGNLDRYQNLGLLFAAMLWVVAELPAARLVLATPQDRGLALRLATDHGAGGFTQVVAATDAAATRGVLQRCALAVHPRIESAGFPIKNLNAAAAGVPVVACASAAHGVEHERTGLVVPDGDPRALAAAIVELLRDPARRRKLGRGGLRLAREKYGRERMCAEVEREWSTLLDR